MTPEQKQQLIEKLAKRIAKKLRVYQWEDYIDEATIAVEMFMPLIEAVEPHADFSNIGQALNNLFKEG